MRFFSYRCALTLSGEVYVYNAPTNSSTPSSTALLTSLRSEKIIDVHCCFNHAVVVTGTGAVRSFELNEAHGRSSDSHISSVAAQPKTIDALSGMGVQRAWILPLSTCHPGHYCSCSIVGLTEGGELYICPAPFNQQRWAQLMGPGAVLIKGLEGESVTDHCHRLVELSSVLLFSHRT